MAWGHRKCLARTKGTVMDCEDGLYFVLYSPTSNQSANVSRNTSKVALPEVRISAS